MTDILCTRNRYIIPFLFWPMEGMDYESLIGRITDTGAWRIWNMYAEGVEQDLYDIIRDCFVMDERKNNIGCALAWCGAREDQRDILALNYTRFDRDFIVRITQMGMYLFRSGVGFIWYEAGLPADATSAELTLFQNEFKELAYERFVSLKNRSGRYTFELARDAAQGVLMGDWLDRKLAKLPFTYSFFANRKNPLAPQRQIPDKALLFVYAVFDRADREKLMDDIYHLTNGYNERYQKKAEFSSEPMELFRYAYCYVTMGGCGYYVVPGEENRNFYLRTLKKKIMLDHFTLYILALYQSYTLLKFTGQIQSVLSAESAWYLENSEESVGILKQIATQINVFLVKSVYSSVSHISHQNDYYEYVIRKLKVRENIDGLTIGLESLQKLQEDRAKERIEAIEERENQEREVSDDRLNIGLGLLSILALISAVADGDSAAEVLVRWLKLPEYAKTALGMVFLALIAVIAVVAVTSIWPSILRAGKKRREWKAARKQERDDTWQ